MNETLDRTNLPRTDAFAITADGNPVAVTAVTTNVIRTSVGLTVSPTIRRGQTVSVAYEDPTAGDDANAIQDAVGNDVADFDRYVGDK